MIAYVAQDAGGANLVLHMALHSKSSYKVFAFGVAADIAKNLGISIDLKKSSVSEVTRVIAGANYRGTVKDSDKFLKVFEEMNLPIDGFLDGWYDLENRFPNIAIRNYLVVDRYSKNIAESIYGTKVRLVKNYYKSHVLSEYKCITKQLSEDASRSRAGSILYFSRPLKQRGIESICSNPNCICPDLGLIKRHFSPSQILIRDHPRLNSNTCLISFSSQGTCKLTRSSGLWPLAPDLAKCDTAIGQSNPALLIAQAAGLRTYTTSQIPQSKDGSMPRFMKLT